jgi:hypothetical protein
MQVRCVDRKSPAGFQARAHDADEALAVASQAQKARSDHKPAEAHEILASDATHDLLVVITKLI